MSFFDGLKQELKQRLVKRQEEKDMIDRIKLEAEAQRRITLEQELRKNSLEMAIGKAKKDAANLSGLRKLRAENRLRNLQKTNPETPKNFLEKMGEYTRRNIAKREENLERTRRLRESAKTNIAQKGFGSGERRKPFSPTRLGGN